MSKRNIEDMGTDPFYSDDGISIRKATEMTLVVMRESLLSLVPLSVSKEDGERIIEIKIEMAQLFFNRKAGFVVGLGTIGIPRNDLRGSFDTIILHPKTYEAVKKSTIESAKADKTRAFKRSGYDPFRYHRQKAGHA